MQMRALKTFVYGRQKFTPGAVVDIAPRFVRAMVALGRVDYIFEPVPPRAAPAAATYNRRDMVAAPVTAALAPAPAPVEQDDELESLRAQYENSVGRKARDGWDAEKLKEKIAAAAQRAGDPAQTGED